MEVVLESLDGDVAPSVEAPVAQASANTAPPAAPEPVKRPRGRPKGSVNKKPPMKQPSPKPKKQRRPPSSSESSEDEPPRQSTRAAVDHLLQDDMETQVLRFLNARKQNQAQQRRSLWQNLAASGLR